MKKLIILLSVTLFSVIVMAQGTNDVPLGYGMTKAAAFRDRVQDSGGTYYNNIAAHEFSKLYSYGITPILAYYPASTDTLVDGSGVTMSQVPIDGSGDFTSTRAGTATFVNSNDTLELAAINVPRIDFRNEIPVLLTEPARTNLFLNSAVGATQTITVVSSSVYTIYFHTGADSIVLSNAYVDTIVASDYNYDNSLTFTAASTSLVCTVIGTVGQVQCELGSYPTSYIPTVGGAVTRSADAITGAGDATLFSSVNSSGVLYVEIAAFVSTTVISSLSLNNNGTGFRIVPSYRTGNNLNIYIEKSGGSIADTTINLADITESHKIAISWNSTEILVYVDGVEEYQLTVDASMPPSSFTKFSLDGNNAGSFPFYGNLYEGAIYNELTPAQMISLTTP